jgi:hypothetical protein
VPRLPEPLARRLLRAEEYEQPHRDQWGNWEFAFCESFRAGRLWEPEVDAWVARQRRAIAPTAELEPLWPDDRAFAVCLTHDVDLLSRASTPKQVLRSLRTSLADPAETVRERVVRAARPAVRIARAAHNGISTAPVADTLELCVQLERERDVGASYFFTVYPGAEASRFDCIYDFGDLCEFRGERLTISDVIRTLHNEGFDVGLHGSYNSALVPGTLAREKAALARATGVEIRTTRQHFLHWNIRTTPRLQDEAGLTADSTLGFNRNVGFRAGTSLPFHHFDLERGERLELLQVPLIVHDGPLLRSDCLELDVELARESIRELVDKVARVGGVATFVFHPNNLERPEFLDLYRWSLDYGIERGAWFASLRELDDWWRRREARLLS